jgi:hypothetical protein
MQITLVSVRVDVYIFAGHRALNAFDDGRDGTSVIFELFGTVTNRDTGPLDLLP